MRQNTDLDTEALEVLNGSRNRDLKRAAVRLEDLSGLLGIVPNLQCRKIASTAATKEEIDAIVTDVTMMHRQLLQTARRLSELLRHRLP